MTIKRLLMMGFIALSISLSALSIASSDGSDFLYTVKKDDTVWAVCKTYVGDPLCWKKLVTYNQLKNPKYLPPESILRIPKSWLLDYSTTALVIAVEGDVLVTEEGAAADTPLNVGDRLSQKDIVKSAQGSAMIEFADHSRLLLKANSIIRMSSLQFYDADQVVNTRVELLRGRVKAQVEKLTNKNSSYKISTPAAVAAVRGTDFRVAHTKNPENGLVEMRTELLTGKLLVDSSSNAQEIEAGQAVLAIEGKGVEAPVALLPRPLLLLNEKQSYSLPLDFKWQALKGAHAYKITLMTQDAQVWEKDSIDPKVLIEDIEAGEYLLLIRGIDQYGFEGRDRRLTLILPETVSSSTNAAAISAP